MKQLIPEFIALYAIVMVVATLVSPIIMDPVKKKQRLRAMIQYGSLFVKECKDIVAVDGREFDDSMTIFF